MRKKDYGIQGALLAKIREENGWSVKMVAAYFSYGVKMWQEIEKGERVLRDTKLLKAAEFFGVNIVDILPTEHEVKEIAEQPRKAPWQDFNGNDIFEGDTIGHPSGIPGVVEFRADDLFSADRWLVDYGDNVRSRLCLQIGDMGRAVVQKHEEKES